MKINTINKADLPESNQLAVSEMREAKRNGVRAADSEEAVKPSLPRLAYSIQETAEMLGISEISVRRLIARGLLRCSQSLRHKLIPRGEIEKFLRTTLNLVLLAATASALGAATPAHQSPSAWLKAAASYRVKGAEQMLSQGQHATGKEEPL